MSRESVMARAQQRYDDMAPEEDGPCECEECAGTGYITTSDGQGNRDDEECPACDGFGLIDEYGNPVNPNETGE